MGADRRFFKPARSITLDEIEQMGLATCCGQTDRQFTLSGVAPLSVATKDDLSFVSGRKFIEEFRQSEAGAVIVPPKIADQFGDKRNLMTSEVPQLAYAKIAQILYPAKSSTGIIHESAFVDETTILGEGVEIAEGAVISAGVEIGEGSRIGANSFVGENVRIGSDTRLVANVTITHALVGDRVTIHPGARIGQDGFGYVASPNGLLKIPQLGRVIIEDDVDIGANSTIDRGAGDDTFIGMGTKIDNLVQIAHNCRIGKFCILVGQVGLSGSVILEDMVVLGGQVGVADHVKIGKGAQIAAQSGIMKDVPAGAKMGGSPAKPISEWHRNTLMMKKLNRR